MVDIFDTQYAEKDIELEDNVVQLGGEVNIIERDPALKKIIIGAGWDVNIFNSDVLDLDVSLFLLDKDGKTRVDEDFVFYNQREINHGAIRHHGDSRTGAGDGDVWRA